MAGPWDGFAAGFGNAFAQALDNRQRQKMLQMEQANKLAQIAYSAQLENQQLTPEQKLYKDFQSNPEFYLNYMKAKDPSFEADQMYKKGMLRIQQGNLAIDQEKLNILKQKPTVPETDLMKNIKYLQSVIPGKSPKELLDILLQRNNFWNSWNPQPESQPGALPSGTDLFKGSQ